ncbi:membrane-associated protein, putative [Bodo saltans]|uniref:Membrane-associated protein, putative n=1 Tax=Bodo saltans TaxID=75058 RepID=A0A0S4KII4_BODSA|nr:membrane-associated protein, putative [Bodo saltans]|eukprot:CUI15491.1 membrane-associated protein, putative [Bodo saltans]
MSDWNTRIVLSIAFGVMMAAAVGTFTGNSTSFVVIYVVTVVLCLLSAMVFAVCKYKNYQLHKRSSSSSLLSKLPLAGDDPTLHIPQQLHPNTAATARQELINSNKSRSRTAGGVMNQQPQHHQHHRHHHHNGTKSAVIRMNELATVTELVTALSLYLSIILYTANISFAKESCLGADNYATSYDQCYKLFNFDANSMMMVLAASVFAPIRFLFHILFVIAVLIAFSVANSLQSNASYVKERFFSSLVILAGQQIACAVWLYRRERDARDAFTMECVLELQNRERSEVRRMAALATARAVEQPLVRHIVNCGNLTCAFSEVVVCQITLSRTAATWSIDKGPLEIVQRLARWQLRIENAFARCFSSMTDDEEDNDTSLALLPFVTLTAETWMGDTARYAAVPSQQQIYHTPTTTTTKSFASQQQQQSSMISNRGGGGVGGATTTPLRAFVASEMLSSAVQVIHAAREVFDDNNQHHNNIRQDELYNGSSGSGASESAATATADSGPSTLDALTTSPTAAIGGVAQNSSSVVDKSHALPKSASKKDGSSAFVMVSLALGSANVSLLPAACATIISGAAVEECQLITRLRHTAKSSAGNNRSEQPQRRISASSLQFTVSDQGILSQREGDFIQQQQQEPQRYGPQETLLAAPPTPQPFVIMSGVICSPAFSASLQGISSSSSKLFTTRAAKTATNPLETLLGFPVTFIAEEEAAVAPPLSPGGPATPASFRPAGGPPGSTRTNNIAADGFPRDIEQELRSVVEAQLADQRQQQQQQQQQLGASSNNNRSLSNRDDGAAVNEVMPQETFALRRRSWFHCLAMEFVNAHVEQEFRHHQSNLYEPAALIMHSFEMIGLAGCMFFISGMYHVWSWEARSSLPYVFSSGCSGVLLFVLTKFVVEPTVVSKRSHLIFLLEFTYWAFMFSCVLTSIMPPQDQSIFSGSVVPWMYVGATVSLQRPRWFPPVGQWLLEALFCVIFVLTAVLPIRDLLSSRIFIQALIGVAMLIFSLILRVLLDAMDRDRYAGRMVLEETQTILEKEAQHLLNLLRSMAPTKEAARRLLKRGRNRGAAVEAMLLAAMLLAGGTQNARRSTSTTSFVAPVRVMTTNVEDLVFAVLSVKQCRPQQVSTSNSYQQPGEISSSVRSRRRSSASTTTISAPPPLPSLLPPATEGFTWCSFSHNILIDVHDCVARCLPAHKAMIVKSFGDCFVFGLDEGELANLRTLNRAEVVQRMVACMQDVTIACQKTIVQCLMSENVENNSQEDVSRRRGGGGVTTDKKSQVYSSSSKNSQAMSTSSSVAQQQQCVSSFQTGGGSHSRGGGGASILLSPTIEARGGAGGGMLVESFSPALISPSQQQQQQLFDCNGIGRGDSHSSQLHFHHAASSGRGGGGGGSLQQQARQNNNALDGAFSTFDVQPHPASSSPKFHIRTITH